MNEKDWESFLQLLRERSALQRKAMPILNRIHGLSERLKILAERLDKERKGDR
jgi:hypothetical protein